MSSLIDSDDFVPHTGHMNAIAQPLQIFEEVNEAPRGRRPGSKNRILSVEEKLERLGLDPIVKLAMMAAQAEDAGSIALAAKLYIELAQYTAAKRKSVEVTVAPDSPLDHAIQLSSAERMARIAAIMASLSK
jgi:hypothetical protein